MTVKYPDSIGACIDKLYEDRTVRLGKQKEIDTLKAAEAALENHILDTFSKIDLAGAKGSVATAGVKKTTVYNIEDWESFVKDVTARGAWDCLQKRLSAEAVAARFTNHEPLAGVTSFVKVSLTLNKAGK